MNLDLKEIILIFLRGLFMGSADIVPGVFSLEDYSWDLQILFLEFQEEQSL